MVKSELVTHQHLSRQAIVYVRQSSPHQVLSNQESLELQYALRQRAEALGWSKHNIETIDTDLGITGSSTEHREGFKKLLAQVALGRIGIILSYDVTRLSRNCSDWYPLLDLCGYKGCLIADRESVYDPSTPDGRLLLGLKGQLSEMELHTIRARLTAGILNKAKRGELALSLPVGLVRDEFNSVTKDPNTEVVSRIELIFSLFLHYKSASKVVSELNKSNLTIPRRDRFRDIIWRKPTVAAILSTLKNPAYAGAFVYGRSRATRTGNPKGKSQQKPVPMSEWKVLINDKYPQYISWETYEKIQSQIRDNHSEYDRNKTRGIPRAGTALLHGLIYCGECGHKMVVQYKGATRYICNYLRQQYRTPVCQYIPADPVDKTVVNAYFEALKPAEIDAYHAALKNVSQEQKANDKAKEQQLERLRYQAALAERQFNKVDPENRLVASELERRWEHALQELHKAQAENIAPSLPDLGKVVPPRLKANFIELGKKMPEIWTNGTLTQVQRKKLLRCLIDKVVVHRQKRDCLRLRVVWKGGLSSAFDVPIHVGSTAELSNSGELESRVLALAEKGVPDSQIAVTLQEEGFRSPMSLSLLPSTVRAIRLKKGIMTTKSQSHPRLIEGFLTIPQLSKSLSIPTHWFYDRINNGTIEIQKDKKTKLYLFPDCRATIKKLKQLREGTLKNLRFS